MSSSSPRKAWSASSSQSPLLSRCTAIRTWSFVIFIYGPTVCRGIRLIFLSCLRLAHCQVWFSSPLSVQRALSATPAMHPGPVYFHFSCLDLFSGPNTRPPCGNCILSLEKHISLSKGFLCSLPFPFLVSMAAGLQSSLTLHSGSLQ